MKTYTQIFFFGLLILLFSCQKDYYLEDLNTAKEELALLSNRLNQIVTSNNQLISDNQDINTLIQNIQTQLSRNEIEVVEIEAEIENIESRIQEALNKEQESLNELATQLQNLLIKLKESNTKNFDLLNNINSLIDKILASEISLNDAMALNGVYLLSAAHEFGVKDGIYLEIKNASWLSEDELQDDTFLNDISRHQRYVEIEKSTIQYFARIFKDNDPNYSSSNKSSEPFVDKSETFSTENIISVYGVEQIKIILKYTTNLGDRYDIIILQKVDEIPFDKTNEELQSLFRDKKTGFFSDPIYSQVNINDLDSFLDVFIADAKRYGRNMNWFNSNNYTLKFDDFDDFIKENGYDPIITSNLNFSCENGGIAYGGTISVSEKWWRNQPFLERHNRHIQFLWERFAVLLLTLDYICESGHILSYCGINNYELNFSDPDENINFQQAARKMFTGEKQKSWLNCFGKNILSNEEQTPTPFFEFNSY